MKLKDLSPTLTPQVLEHVVSDIHLFKTRPLQARFFKKIYVKICEHIIEHTALLFYNTSRWLS